MSMRMLGSVFGSFGILLMFTIGVGAARADAPQNVILMIGDGMGPEHVELARRFEPDGILVMDELDSAPGFMTTHNYWGETTDSAAAATAMATGMKTHNGALAMVPDPNNLEEFEVAETAWERAEANGKTTGIVSNVHITDATPGVWAAHVVDRGLYAEIAEQQAFGGVEVLLGACVECYLPDWKYGANIDLIEILTSDDPELGGYDYVTRERDLRKAGEGGKLLGLFAGFSMTSTIDRPLKKKMTEPTLAQMTDKAIEILSRNSKGFFLMVEGGEIDWMGHKLDAAGTLRETQSFDEAVAVALDFAVRDGNTLLIVTADHETGDLHLPADPDDLNMDFLEGIRASTKFISEEIEDGLSLEEALKTYAGIGDDWPALTQEEEQAIESCDRVLGISDLFNARAGVSYSSGNCNGGSHTSTQVPIFATGPGADQFDGTDLDNTDLGVLLLEAVSGN